MSKVGLTLVIVVGLLWGLTTSSRIAVWGSEARLWDEAVRVTPTKPRAWINAGAQWQRAGEYGRAHHAYDLGLALAATRPPDERRIAEGLAEVNLALLYFEETGDRAGAYQMAARAEDSRLVVVAQVIRWLAPR